MPHKICEYVMTDAHMKRRQFHHAQKIRNDQRTMYTVPAYKTTSPDKCRLCDKPIVSGDRVITKGRSASSIWHYMCAQKGNVI